MNLVIREVFPTDCFPKKTTLYFLSGFIESTPLIFFSFGKYFQREEQRSGCRHTAHVMLLPLRPVYLKLYFFSLFHIDYNINMFYIGMKQVTILLSIQLMILKQLIALEKS